MSPRIGLLLLAVGILGGGPAQAQALRRGILIAPFREDTGTTLHGQAGDTILFREVPGSSIDFDVQYQGRLVSLATQATRLFAYHPYRDHFAGLECRAVYRLELEETDAKTDWKQSLACIDAYLREFPAGRYRDELEWLGVQLRHAVYEYEGDPVPAVRQVRAYTAYLEQHPDHTLRLEIEFEVARLCYMIAEMLSGDLPDSGFTASDRGAYRERAERIYQRLQASADPAIASRAAVWLYNLRAGRRIYGDPNAW